MSDMLWPLGTQHRVVLSINCRDPDFTGRGTRHIRTKRDRERERVGIIIPVCVQRGAESEVQMGYGE
jgi:hypothetical protein